MRVAARSHRHPLAIALVVVATFVVGIAGAVAYPQAAAAAGGVQVSPDGVTYGSTYPGALFDSVASVVPGDAQSETFYIRNSGTEAGFLRITLRDVVAPDVVFADALSVTASTVGHAGTAVRISQADPCFVLLEGQRVAPGGVVQVTTTLALGNLDGQAGQGSTAALALRVALSSAVVQLPPTHCGQSGSSVTVTPNPRPAPLIEVPGDITSSAPPAEVEPELPVLNFPGLLGIDPNTWRLFEEYFVFVLIGAFAAGTAWFAFVAWRRRKNEADAGSDAEPSDMEVAG